MKNILSTKNTIYVVLAVSTIMLSGLLLFPAIQQPNSQTNVLAASSWFDVFIEIDGIEGSSGHQNAIDVMSWSFGASNPTIVGTGSGLSGGKVSISSFNFMKRIDKSSPMLYSKVVKGEHIKNAVLHVRRGNTDLLKITLSDVLVSSWSLSGSGGDNPTESLSLNFSEVQFSYDLKAAKK